MKAEIINTGTELFLDEIANINLTYISDQLIKFGWEPAFHTTVPDNLDYMVTALHTALKRARLVIITGGLGATSDDLTRFAIALATQRELQFNRLAYQTIENFFKKLGRPGALINRIQADIPKGALVLPNRIGTAPGFWLKIPARTGHRSGGKDKIIIALPGVPEELKEILTTNLLSRLPKPSKKSATMISSKLLIFGISESHLQEEINNLELSKEITISITASNNGVLSLRLIANTKTRKESEKILNRTESLIKASLGKLIFGCDEDTLEKVVGQLLINRKLTIAVAESCTGGLLSHRLTNVPGISKTLKEGLICYSNESKVKRLGISKRIIKRYGAVSPEVTQLMARNITRPACRRQGCQTDLGVGITGIAGPSRFGGTKRDGLVYIAVHSCLRRGFGRQARNSNKADDVLKYQFIGPRIVVKERATSIALNLIRLRLLENT